MARRLVPLITGYYYHVYNRGVNKRRIFTHKHEYVHTINLIKFYNYVDYPIRFSKFMLLHKDQRKEIWQRLSKSNKYTDILSYCLMPNHFHFLIKQNVDHGISKFIGNFQNSYVKYFNIKNQRVGPLFQGQFKAVKIDTKEQLLHVSRYIHLNPYSSGIVANTEKLASYKWSSLQEYLNEAKFPFCDKDDILSNFKSKNSYKEFVLNNAGYQKELEDTKHYNLE